MKLDKEQKYKLKKLIKKLEKPKKTATEMISVYIPDGHNINDVKNQLAEEYSLSTNIKSKQTRKAVLEGIEKIQNELKNYRQTPKNGLILFAGDMEENRGKTDIKLFKIIPPAPLSVRTYHCGKKFLLKPLKYILEPKRAYGLISIDRQDAAIALLKGTIVEIKYKESSAVPGKFKAGGQSAARFQRVRENLAKSWYDKISRYANRIFDNVENIEGIIIGGPSLTKKEFVNRKKLRPKYREKIITFIDTGYSGEDGIRELVEKSKELLEKEKIYKEKKIIKEFLTRLKKDELVTYGKEHVLKAIKMGAVEKVIIIEEAGIKTIDKIKKLAEQYGTGVRIVSTDTEEGEQLKNLGEIGALLRFKIGQ